MSVFLFQEACKVPRGRKLKPKVELKYSLLNETFTSTIGKQLPSNLQNSISKWTKDKNDQNAKELIERYVKSLPAHCGRKPD